MPLFFLTTLATSFLLTSIVRQIAIRYQILDYPDKERKQHAKATPLLGGVAIFSAVSIILYLNRDILVSGNLEIHHWLGVFIASLVLMIGGIIDDIKKLSPSIQIIFPIIAALIVVVSGVGVEKVSALGGGYFYLDVWTIPLFSWGGQMIYFNVISDLFTIIWLLGMAYTTKLLDGVDGLVASVAGIGSLVIFLFTTTTRWAQSDIAFAALILAGACLGYLILSWHPAKIFLGEGGSLFLGFMLGVLSIISGGKIAIALLIMGIPVLDVVWTIIRRLLKKKNPFKFADREHLHFRLLDAGLSQRQTVIVFSLASLLFGLSALFLQSRGKLYTLFILGFLMIALIIGFTWLDRKRVMR